MSTSTIIIIALILAFGVVFCLCLSIANYAGDNYHAHYLELDKVQSSTGLTIEEFFNLINNKHFDGKIKVYINPKEGYDAYSKGRLFLSPKTVKSNSLASLAIVAHELGHALQDKTSKQLKRLTALRILGKYVGFLMFPLLVSGIILAIIGGKLFYYGVGLATGGILIFLLAILIRVLTLKIEKGASKNAIGFLKDYLPDKEIKQIRKFLKDARLTYWGDMFRALLGWTKLTRKGDSKLFRR